MKLKNVTMGQIKLLGRKEDESEDEKERVHLVRVWMPLKPRFEAVQCFSARVGASGRPGDRFVALT